MIPLGTPGIDPIGNSPGAQHVGHPPRFARILPAALTGRHQNEALPQLIQVEAIADERELQLHFAVPPLTPEYRSKPLRSLGSLIGHEGEGSLLSRLKEENLATALSAGGRTDTYVGYLGVTIALTEATMSTSDSPLCMSRSTAT